MKLLKFYVASVLLVLSVNSSYSQSTTDFTTPQEVIQKAIEVMGGKEYLESISTLYTDSKTILQGHDVNYVIKEMAPNKGSFEIVYNQHIMFGSYFNGKTGYQVSGSKKSKESADVYKDKKYKKHIFNELDYLNPELWKLQLIGQEAVNGDACYKIKAVLASGTTEILYYSKKMGLLLKDEKLVSQEERRYNAAMFSEFKQFGKLFYHSVETFINDGVPQQMKIEKLLVNENVSESDFEIQ
ncbi:hypothetical protein [Mucilaginibacter lacusdianchii]|uniref:hypothetical protein n=1 Tax=Mucilaginibacter lacusdianchii TaxID=2684211 RepID=UPI00131C0E36|nr:hypothetical protein [Mucilaginibacter sp. JXJ CY 39]